MRWLGQLVFIVGIVAGALWLTRLPVSAMPQVVKGDDALSVAFGDARAVIARMMIEKSNSYFHGGIDIVCPDKHCEEGEHERCEHHHCEGLGENCHKQTIDPWNWLNTRICAPRQHVHLDGEKSVELLPFYWAALKANPHDIEAWITAIFIASNQLRDDTLTASLIAEAKKKNPESAEIFFTEGRFLYKKGENARVASYNCFKYAERLLNQKGAVNWTEDDKALSNLIQTFLTSWK